MSEFKIDPVLDYPPPPRTHDGQFSDGKPSISSYAPPSDPRGAPSSSAASNGSAPSTPCKLFVGQIPAACTEDDLHRLFAPYGKLLEIVIFRNKHPTDRDRAGYGFITYDNRASAMAAIQGLHFKVQMPKSNVMLQVKLADGNSTVAEPKLFVGNLAPEVSEQELRDAFSPYGPVVETVILRNSDGTSRGSGFVRYQSMEVAQAAIEALNGRVDLRGRFLTVSLAENSRDKQRRKGGPDPPMYGRAHGAHSYSPYEQDPYGGANYPPSSYYPPSQYPQSNRQSGNLDNVIHGIEARLMSRAASEQPNQMPDHQNPPYMPPSSGPPPSYPPPMNTYATAPTMPQSYLPSAPQPSAGDSLLSMMMPSRPSATSGGGVGDANMKAALGSKQEGPRDANLFILHFPREWNNADLYQAFAPYGRIVSANIFLDKGTGESKCFGFVSYDHPQAAQAAVSAMNGLQVGTKRIKVELKRQ